MKKILISSFILLLLNSCVLVTLVDGIASAVLDIFVYNEKTEQIYQFTAEAQKANIKLDVNKIYTDNEGRQIISYQDLPEQYRSLLVIK